MAKAKAKKPTKTNPSAQISVRDRLIQGALQAAAALGWEHVTPRDICAEAGLELSDFYDHFDDKSDLLVAYGRRLDKMLIGTYADITPPSSPRDLLFDIIMERLDHANADRKAVISILNSFKFDPKQAIITCPHLARSMSLMLDLAHIDTNGIKGAVRVAGLTALYIWVLRTWVEDESTDLSRTMATLDKSLAHVENWAERLVL
jgi:AcrR family transcriptional regulator